AGMFPKYCALPLANYAPLPFDKVQKDGRTVGLSTYTAYTYNERAMLSLGCIENELSGPGTEVTLVWGEGGRARRGGGGKGGGEKTTGGRVFYPGRRRAGLTMTDGARGILLSINTS